MTGPLYLMEGREAGHFDQKVEELEKFMRNALLHSPTLKKHQCHPERSEGSHRSIHHFIEGSYRLINLFF